MIDNSPGDIVDQINTVVGDEASWTAAIGDGQPWWITAPPGAMTAVRLGMTDLGVVEISESESGRDIAHHVGDPVVGRICHLRRVQFWVGDNSVANSPINHRATEFLHQLLNDVRDGNYIASDDERDHARALLNGAGNMPVIHGPCLITGVGDSGVPAPLDKNFESWFTACLESAVLRMVTLIIAAEIIVVTDSQPRPAGAVGETEPRDQS